MTATNTCPQTEHATEYALRVLQAAEASAYAVHVRDCAECQRELAALQRTVEAFVDWPTDVLRSPTPLWSRLAERIGEPAAREPESRWVDEPPWKAVAPGISCKLLSTDAATHRVSILVRLAPNVDYPPHTHAGVEELYLLDGELWIDDRKLYPGDYNRAEPGTADARVWSETGCTCVLITSPGDILG